MYHKSGTPYDNKTSGLKQLSGRYVIRVPIMPEKGGESDAAPYQFCPAVHVENTNRVFCF